MNATPVDIVRKAADSFANDQQGQQQKSKYHMKAKKKQEEPGARLDVAEYLTHYDIPFKVKQHEAGEFFCLDTCLFDAGHGRDAAILQMSSGVLLYKCFHDSCKDKTWQDARKIVAGDDNLGKYSGGNDDKRSPYFMEDGYLCKWKKTRYGDTILRLANFSASVISENILDDGQDKVHFYVIEGQQNGRALPPVEIPANQFASMNWTYRWGVGPAIEPGQSIKDYVRHAIQISNDAPQTFYYAHTGWRVINGEQTYITAAGAIGGQNVSVKLSKENARYSIPLSPENELEAIGTSISFIELGNHDVTLPLFAITYLAPLTTLLSPMPNFSNYLFGQTGTFKSTISGLQLSHFGDFDNMSCLSNFEDTANSLEKRAFTLKDTLLILDDYHPASQRRDALSKENIAQRLIRGYSNRTGRSRMNSDTTEKGRYEPRGMLQITGEEIVSLQSTMARVVLIEISVGDINIEKLSLLQKKSHLLQHAMSSYIHWIRVNMKDIQKKFPARFRELRAKANTEGIHRKLPEQIAFFVYTLELVTKWAVEKNAISAVKAEELVSEGWEVFTRLSAKHDLRIADEDPVKRFDDIVNALLLQETVKLQPVSGAGAGKASPDAYSVTIGYCDNENRSIYLMPTPLWNQIHRYCGAESARFPLSKTALYKMLRERKMIELGKGGSNEVHKWLCGKTMKVLKIIRGGLYDSVFCDRKIYETEESNEK